MAVRNVTPIVAVLYESITTAREVVITEYRPLSMRGYHSLTEAVALPDGSVVTYHRTIHDWGQVCEPREVTVALGPGVAYDRLDLARAAHLARINDTLPGVPTVAVSIGDLACRGYTPAQIDAAIARGEVDLDACGSVELQYHDRSLARHRAQWARDEAEAEAEAAGAAW